MYMEHFDYRLCILYFVLISLYSSMLGINKSETTSARMSVLTKTYIKYQVCQVAFLLPSI
jgi:hypothetical protein